MVYWAQMKYSKNNMELNGYGLRLIAAFIKVTITFFSTCLTWYLQKFSWPSKGEGNQKPHP